MAAAPLPLRTRRPLRPTTSAEQRANILQWMPGAAKLAMRSANMQDVDRDDAIQEAFLQLCKTAQTYNPAVGTQFSTLAMNSVRFHMLTAFHDRRSLGYGGLRCSDRNSRNPPPTRSVEGLPWDLQPIEAENGDEDLSRFEPLYNALRRLDQRSYYIVIMRVVGGETLVSIGRTLGISKERVRQIEKKAMTRLRKLLAAE